MKQKQINKTSAFSSKSSQIVSKNKTKLHAILNKVLVCGIFVSMIAYIATINDLSIKGFILQDLRGDVQELSLENEHFELVAMNLESYEQINERAKKLGMVKVGDIKYVSMVDGAVAVK